MRTLFLLALLGAAPLVQAADIFTKIDPAPKSELWIDTGFYTAHFDGDKDLNNNASAARWPPPAGASTTATAPGRTTPA
jgi:hypothetical protein